MKKASLLPLVRKFFEHDGTAAARALETMEPEEAVGVLTALPAALSAEAFSHLQIEQATALLRQLPKELFGQILKRMTPHQGALVFAQLPPEARLGMLEALPERTRHEIKELLTYPEDSAGRIMTTDFLAFHTDTKVRDATQRIRTLAHKKAPASYAYVVDGEGRLGGVINMRDLLLASGEEKLEAVMRREVFSISGFMDREEVVNEMSRRKFFAVPVVDSERRLVGVVKTEELLQDVQEEATEDLQKLFGAGGDEEAFSPICFSLRKRLPWLHVNLATAFLAAAVVGLFEEIIAQITVLAVFLPVVAGQGGNAGAQSLAVVMRGLVMREIPPGKVRKMILKETWIGVLNGLLIGLVVGVAAWLWKGNLFLGVVIGLAMVVNLIAAGFAGALIPLALKAVGRDPAQSSSIILTTITDIVGFFAFLGFAVLFRGLLL